MLDDLIEERQVKEEIPGSRRIISFKGRFVAGMEGTYVYVRSVDKNHFICNIAGSMFAYPMHESWLISS